MAAPALPTVPAILIPARIVSNLRLSAFDKYLAGFVIMYARAGRLELSLSQLCMIAGASYATTRNSLNRLQAEGILKYRAKEGKGGGVKLRLAQNVAAAVAAALLTFGGMLETPLRAGEILVVGNKSMDYTTGKGRRRRKTPILQHIPPPEPVRRLLFQGG